jgi:hypothetical protein
MSAPQIKRDLIKHEKRTHALLRAAVATVAVAQDTTTGEILAVGLDHAAVAARLAETPQRGNWEIKEHRLWR